MVMVTDSAKKLKGFLRKTKLTGVAHAMVLRISLAFILHRGRMSCSQAGCAILSEPVHRGQVSRFLARPRWQKLDFNAPLRHSFLKMEKRKGRYIFIVDATLCSQSGKTTQNTFSTGNRTKRSRKSQRYGKNRHSRRTCHSFTFGLLITPSGHRIPFQIPHYTKEYCKEHGITHLTTAQAAAELIRTLPVPEDADVIVLGDTAYDAKVVRKACDQRNYTWIVPANPERVYEGPRGKRPQLRSRLKNWKSLSLKTIRLHASKGKYADYRRLSRWRIGPKMKPRVYYAHQEIQEVRSIGRVQLVFSTMKSDLKKATPGDVKILLTNATKMSVSEVLDLYSLRWQIELFFKELKSTLGFNQYRFKDFKAVEAWVNIAIATVLYLEWYRAEQLKKRRVTAKEKRCWSQQRLHGLCEAVRQQIERDELKFMSDRIKTPGGTAKLQRLLQQSSPAEYRTSQ